MEIPPQLVDCGAETAIVLGSGLGLFAKSLPEISTIEYRAIEGLPTPGVPSQAGRFLVTQLGDRPLLIAQGRVHLYEGWSVQDVVRSIQLMHVIGIKNFSSRTPLARLTKPMNPALG